ncbi:hypothetical protein WJX81_003621 [Elliptochloris bilobata]|uniref:RecA family profile 1 domain-containing protein n=1 Tax=Elliptochloris bilobata TaxID=381761 RepID=A0AAW1R2N5_9CHLO
MCGQGALDALLRGGVPCGAVTELCGEASAAKTQLCLQLLLCTQLPPAQGGLDGTALYIYTEGDPPLKRLQQLADVRPQLCRGDGGAFDNVFVERGVASGEELLMRLERLRPLLADPPRQPVRLLVIDSVAHLFRDAGAAGDHGQDGRDCGGGGLAAYAARAELLFRLAALLKLYADEFRLAVVVINQVTDVVGDERSGRTAPLCRHTAGQRLQTAGREVAAQPVMRCMQVVFSPYLPTGFCYFTLNRLGRSAAACLHEDKRMTCCD